MSSQSSNGNASTASSKFSRGVVPSKNPLWGYVTVKSNKAGGRGNTSWTCHYCDTTFNGSYSRVRGHLIRVPQQGVSFCKKVSDDCFEEMKQIEREAVEKAKLVQVLLPTGTTSLRPPLDDGSKKRKGGALEKAWNNKARDQLTSEIARFFYSAGLPFNVARNPYFVKMLNFAANNTILGFRKGFLKFVDGSGEFKDKHYIARKILETICDVGPLDVVQVITDNAPVCKAAGSIIEIVDTRFASTLIMLKRLRDVKHGLQAMVIDEQWSSYQEDDPVRATFVKETILKDSWWKEVDYILSFTNPIYDMLRACDTDESTLHLIYEKWDCMIEQVKVAIFQHEGKGLDEYLSFYEVAIAEVPNRVPPHKDNEICIGRMQCLRRYFQDARERNEAFQEFFNFSTRAEGLDRFYCLQDRWDLMPKVWWVTYGAALPKLQTIALKLFSQPSSSSSAERNWST
ncbi:uncharacterized protein LOC130712794 [Lotus japonicus]|uniref:uncharacterized protein LOC130712794 n=1 Tax=Lotus japonicus TaxID=34305 RepID=UPI00258B7E58|nr:uncharacterized protein LOC130712794 [Lotus japonicus]